MALRVRAMADGEMKAIERLAQSRSEPVRAVERAKIVWLAWQGRRVPAIARELGVGEPTVRLWLKRFNAKGVEGSVDERRSGHPPTYTPEQVGEVIATSLTKPATLGLPFASWTLDRLAAYLNEQRGIAIKRSRIDEILLAEGLRWRSQETWFGERVDPDFAPKRGRSRASTQRRRRVASSSVLTRWDRSRPRRSQGLSSSRLKVTQPTTPPPSEPSVRSTTDVAARATSSGRSGRRLGRPSASPIRDGRSLTGSTSWRRSTSGFPPTLRPSLGLSIT